MYICTRTSCTQIHSVHTERCYHALTLRKIFSMHPLNLSWEVAVMLISSFACSASFWNFWGVNLFKIPWNLRYRSYKIGVERNNTQYMIIIVNSTAQASQQRDKHGLWCSNMYLSLFLLLCQLLCYLCRPLPSNISLPQLHLLQYITSSYIHSHNDTYCMYT